MEKKKKFKKKKKTTNQLSPQKKSVWLIEKQQAIDYQRAAQMTWWSILQGLAVAALAENTHEVLPDIVSGEKWFYALYALTSALVIVSSWVQMSWAIALQRWPVNVTHTAFTLLLGITSYLMALSINEPANWFYALLAVIVSAIIIYGYNLRTKAILILPSFITIRTIVAYIGYGIISAIAAYYIQNPVNPDPEKRWAIVIFILAITDWLLQSQNIKEQNEQMDIQ